MPIESRQVWKEKTIGIASPDETLPTTAGCGNVTFHLLARCFIVDSDPPPQNAQPPNQFI